MINFENSKVNHAKTRRYQKSSIINMQTLLNLNEAEKKFALFFIPNRTIFSATKETKLP